jgi:acyl carrier protein
MADQHNETLEGLSGIWASTLGVKNVGADDNFFAKGGHSLLAVKLIEQVQKKFGVALELSDLYEYPTLGEFSEHLKSLSSVS